MTKAIIMKASRPMNEQYSRTQCNFARWLCLFVHNERYHNIRASLPLPIIDMRDARSVY